MRKIVNDFAGKMNRKLDDNENRTKKRHWCQFDIEELQLRAIKNIAGGQFIDGANYCMMANMEIERRHAKLPCPECAQEED